MKIVIAADKFKGSLSAAEAGRAIAEGIRHAAPDVVIDQCPMADGGEGTVAALVTATGGRLLHRTVTGPLVGMQVDAEFGLLGNGSTAVIEMAAASGLALLKPEQRNPMRTTTYGTGELLRTAVESGARRIILGIGGSATVDGGIGCLQGWGARIHLENGASYGPTDRKLTGSDVGQVVAVDLEGTKIKRTRAPAAIRPRTRRGAAFGQAPADGPFLAAPRTSPGGIEFIVACDVGNPLYGPKGAAEIFGPQKGATDQQVKDLDAALERLARRTGAPDLAEVPGAGAAGGLGFAMMAFFHAELRSGIEIVMDATRLADRLADANLCITGEGRLDAQSLAGKTAVGVSRLCKKLGVPCIALCGSLGPGAELSLEEGITACFSICDRPMSLEEAMADAPRLLRNLASNVMRLYHLSLRGE